MNPTPLLMSVTVEPKTSADHEKMAVALSELAQQDPIVKVRAGPAHGQTIIAAKDELHLQRIVDRIRREHRVDADVGEPQINYRETIRRTAEAESRYIRQTGGSGNYAHVKLHVAPNQPDSGYAFANDIEGGAIPQQYIRPIDEAIQNAMGRGVLAGYEMVDIKVSLVDGSYHDVDSNEMAFRIAASIAFKEAARGAKPVLLEPMMAVAVTTPDAYLGTIIDDLNRRRGRIRAMELADGVHIINAAVPLSDLLGYAAALHASTHGRARVSMNFEQYEVSPVHRGGDPDEPHTGVTAPTRPRPGGGRYRPGLTADPNL